MSTRRARSAVRMAPQIGGKSQWRITWRSVASALFALIAVLAISLDAAAEDCVLGGRGRICTSASACSGAANACVNGTCQVPCGVVPSGSLDEQPKPALCTLGETCSAGTSSGKTKYFCKPTPFRVDLNLLDSCIYHFVEGLQPDLEAGSSCSVIRQLTNLLDQNGNGKFDIYDVDACIKTFLGEEPCNTTTQICPNSQTYCATDSSCGEGLFCNTDLHRCERECGSIVSRDNNEPLTLDRKCAARLQTCDYERGKCRDVSLENGSCQLDRDCPTGSYCLVGQCQPRCYRTLDCPDSTWYCSTDNTCLPKPKSSDGGASFNPKEYSVVYSVDEIELDPFQKHYSVPILIMNLKTGKQVFKDPKVAFGYRLETKYERKQSAKCNGDLTKLTPTEQMDCIIAPEEEFLTLGNPFGTLYAEGDPTTEVTINSAADKLSPGYYPVLVTAFFSNGQSTTTRITFRKPSPSGEYTGRLSAYLGNPDAHLANSNVSMQLYIKTPEEVAGAQMVTWSQFLTDNNLTQEQEFQDITEGYPVTGYLHAGQSLIFDVPGAAVTADNEIPIKGIYSPQIGRMRLIAVIELPGTYCRNSAGNACNNSAGEWSVNNAFQRTIRRIVEFIGPFRTAERLFEGMYRETVSGLAPHVFTIEGGFRLVQQNQNSTAVNLASPLLVNTAQVSFPTTSSISTSLQAALNQACGATVGATLATKAAVDQYLASYGTAPPTFPNVVLEASLRTAITSPANTTATLTLTEFLAGQIKLCSATVTSNCIDKTKLACGLAFFRNAAVQNWFDRTALGKDSMGQNASPALFCNRSAVPAENTCADATKSNAYGAVMLQDHNRFYRELTQTYTYQANSAWSEAFYVAYKATENGNYLGASSAYAFRETKLREAVSNYDSARAEMFGSAAAAVMFSWPMERFQGQGQPWLKQMQTVANDRLDAWVEVADLKRRIMQTADLERLYTFAKHVVAQEYLVQIYLAELQRKWQGLNFAYTGGASETLSRSEVLLTKLSESRNPLGLHPNRVYFENSDPALTNWQSYRAETQSRAAIAKTAAQNAITNLHGALESNLNLKDRLRETEQGRNATLDDICGAVTLENPNCRISAADKQVATSCVGEGCAYDWTCDMADEDGRCSRVVRLFSEAVNDVSCRSDINPTNYSIALGKDTTGQKVTRPCNHGRVGGLAQERVKLDLQRKETKRRVESLLRQIAREETELADSRASNATLIAYLETQRAKFAAAEAGVAVAEFAYDAAKTTAEAVDCMIILGFAAGTDCPQKVVSAGLMTAAIIGKYAVVPALQLAMTDMQRSKEITFQEQSANKELRNLRLHLDSLVSEIEAIIAEYAMLTQQLYSVDMQVADTLAIAQNVASRYAQQTDDLVARLVGQDSGQTLRAGGQVRIAEAEFQTLLVDAYKMTRAFLHRYNYVAEAANLTNSVYQALTVTDVENLIATLNTTEKNYCGVEGIDCDSSLNRQVFKFSMRDQLFPGLRDIVDPTNGNFLTAGEQFHNVITSSIFRRRRVVQGTATEHIELPFTIWASDLGDASSAARPVMLDRGDCNHIIAADRSNGSGTIGVNATLTRANSLKYNIIRGGTDHLRSCDPGAVIVNTFKVGSPVIESASQKAFQTRSSTFDACANGNTAELFPLYWYYFARDRSLAAPDWILSIPLENQQWILGIDQATGAPIAESQRGIIEDLAVHIRYNARAARTN